VVHKGFGWEIFFRKGPSTTQKKQSRNEYRSRPITMVWAMTPHLRGDPMTDEQREALTPLAEALEFDAESVLELLRELLADDAANNDAECERAPFTKNEREAC
jgi:hypothetical protein